MSDILKEFKFEKVPLKIAYFDKEPLNLSNELTFFHNKSKFRKYLTQLQYLIKSFTNTPLQAAGIRDSYLKEEFSEKFLIVLLSTSETIKKTFLTLAQLTPNPLIIKKGWNTNTVIFWHSQGFFLPPWAVAL